MALNKLKFQEPSFNEYSQLLSFDSKDIVIKVEGLYKKFCRSLKRSMYYGSIDIFRNMLGIHYKLDYLRKNEFWALEDINFELKKGETLGILGINGSGKSTLLRLLNGIFPPDKGRIAIKGKIGALIALGAGFHPQMTGRENIYLNGTILGMSRNDINKKLDSIIEFADIGDFLDAPVSTYSSGMSVRLGFSIAIHCVPEVLLIDEVLAVGDVDFQKKCFEKILDLKRDGVSTIFVSHSISNLERICEKGLLLNHGKQMFFGDIRECTKEYMNLIYSENKAKALDKVIVSGVGNVTFSNVYVYQEGNDKTNSDIEFGKNIIIEFEYSFKEKLTQEYQLRIGIRTYEGHDVQKIIFQECPFTDGRIYENEKRISLKKDGKGFIRILNPRLFPQVFRLDIAVQSLKMCVHEGAFSNVALFRVTEPLNNNLYFEYGNMTITEFDYEIKFN